MNCEQICLSSNLIVQIEALFLQYVTILDAGRQRGEGWLHQVWVQDVIIRIVTIIQAEKDLVRIIVDVDQHVAAKST